MTSSIDLVTGDDSKEMNAAAFFMKKHLQPVLIDKREEDSTDAMKIANLQAALSRAAHDCSRQTGMVEEDALSDMVYAYNWAGDATGADSKFSRKTSIWARADWYGFGCPTYQIGHKLAAIFAITTVTEEILNSAEMPFPAVLVEMPSGLLKTGNANIRAVLLYKMTGDSLKSLNAIVDGAAPQERWFVNILTDTDVSLKFSSGVFSLLVSEGIMNKEVVYVEDGSKSEAELANLNHKPDTRSVAVALKITANAILYATASSQNVKRIGKGHDIWKNNNGRQGAEPTKRVFVITRDVVHDFREDVAKYLAGESHKLSTQFAVAGHWRLQPHGTGRSLVKRIFIDPYWKGETDVAIALRKHKLK